MSLFASTAPRPVLVPVDKGYSRIPFQFVAENVTQAFSAGWAEGNAMNRDNPILQFTHGMQKVLSFEARLFAETNVDTIQPLIEKLEASVTRDPKLGRPPIWIFVWGSVFDIQCVVESIGGVRYDNIRPDGTFRGATCSMTLRRYEPFDLEVTDPDARPKDTFYRVVREGDLWEHLAARQYGDALKGELLRRLNPSQPTPVVGKTVLMPDADKFYDVIINPEAAPLARTEDGIALRRTMFAQRAKARVSTVLKK